MCVLCVVIARKCQGTNRLGRRAKSCRPPSRTTSGTLRIGRERKGKKEEKVERIIERESVCVCALRVCGRKREEERKKAGNQFREMKERRGQERESVTQVE